MEFLGACNDLLQCIDNPHLAVKEALSWLQNEGRQHVCIEMDCLNVCQLLNFQVQDHSYVGSAIEDIREMARHLEAVSFHYIHIYYLS